MRRAVFVTGHYLHSKRRAGLHFLADGLWRAGWHVTFLTVAISRLSQLKRDHRLQYGVIGKANRIDPVDIGLDSYVWLTALHPLNRLPKPANLLLDPLLRRYGTQPLGEVEDRVRRADLLVFESTAGVMLHEQVRRLNPAARYAYRVSDDLTLLRANPRVLAAEARMAPTVDIISVPTESMLARFASLPNAHLHFHGIDKEAFDHPRPSPYPGQATNAVFVGSTHFDLEFLELASSARRDWQFHVIGPIKGLPAAPNVRGYGELPFAQTIPYLQHADVGLNTLRRTAWTESLGDSLKVIQYSYLRLPVVMPDYMASTRANVVTYSPGDAASIARALTAARAVDRAQLSTNGIRSWQELALVLAGDLPA